MTPNTVLLIDDDPGVLKALKRTLRDERYRVVTADSGDEALKMLESTDVAVIVCDQQMPGLSGAETLAASVQHRPKAVRITLTASTELADAQACVNDGHVSYYLLKPWDKEQLRTTLRGAVRQYRLERRVERLHQLTTRQRDRLRAWNDVLNQRVQERTAALVEAYEDTLQALALALDNRERCTGGHSRRVAVYSLYLAMEMGVPASELENLFRGAMLHDIGKIGIPDAVLLKPGPLTPQERAVMEQHVRIGTEMLEKIGYLRDSLSVPRYHHEKYNGTGYLEKLAGDRIPLAARVFAVIDVYDALTNDRPYKQALPHAEAVEMIRAEAGRHFDPRIVAVFTGIPEASWQALAAIADSRTSYREILAACDRQRRTP